MLDAVVLCDSLVLVLAEWWSEIVVWRVCVGRQTVSVEGAGAEACIVLFEADVSGWWY